MATDFLGNEYGIGDTIVYAAMSGRSVNMVLAEIVSFNESGTTTVQPLEGARWKQHSSRTRYIDSRSGKGIDPWFDKHIEVQRHYIHNTTGERIDDLYEIDWRLRGEYRTVPVVYKDYVTQVTSGPKPVTLQITKNIVKVDRPAPAEAGAEI